ncbi:MAG: glutathione S-transferase family protein [Pseudomonadales bacterium]
MLKVFHVAGTRSVRPVWLCYELDLPVLVEQIDFTSEYRDSKEWRAISPAGKVPALIDDDLVMFESGAMVDYILERYGDGRLRPQPGTAQSAHYHQWCWFAEATLIRPLGLYRVLRAKNETVESLVSEGKRKFDACLAVVEDTLADRRYMIGSEFTAADVMMGYSVAMVERLLGKDYPNTTEYLRRLKDRAAYQKVLSLAEERPPV